MFSVEDNFLNSFLATFLQHIRCRTVPSSFQHFSHYSFSLSNEKLSIPSYGVPFVIHCSVFSEESSWIWNLTSHSPLKKSRRDFSLDWIAHLFIFHFHTLNKKKNLNKLCSHFNPYETWSTVLLWWHYRIQSIYK